MQPSSSNHGRLHQRHKRTPSIPLRVRSTSIIGDAPLSTTLLSPSNAELPPAEPFRTSPPNDTGNSSSKGRHAHAALPQKASEKYGFVIYVGSLIAWYLFLFWSFTPDRYIKALGIEWYPNREWALLIPSWIMATVVYVYIAYFALNLYHTPAMSSMTCITDTQGKIHPKFREESTSTERTVFTFPPYSIRNNMENYEDDYIPPLYDLPVNLINQAVFGNE